MEELELQDENINKAELRIKDLSSKVRTTSEERDAAKAAAEAADTKRIAAEKERDFYASFSDVTSKYSAASEYKDKIREKVLSGYSMEDAAVAVLHREGKFSPAAPTAAPLPNIAGGSAPNQIADAGVKSPRDMSRDERRNALLEAEKRGDISLG